MKSQKPAEGIMLVKEYNDARIYQIECECTDPDHAHTIWIEKDKDLDSVSVTVYTTNTTPFWSTNRWKTIWELLTNGHVKREVTLLLNKQQALNYADALKKAIKDLE